MYLTTSQGLQICTADLVQAPDSCQFDYPDPSPENQAGLLFNSTKQQGIHDLTCL